MCSDSLIFCVLYPCAVALAGLSISLLSKLKSSNAVTGPVDLVAVRFSVFTGVITVLLAIYSPYRLIKALKAARKCGTSDKMELDRMLYPALREKGHAVTSLLCMSIWATSGGLLIKSEVDTSNKCTQVFGQDCGIVSTIQITLENIC